LPFSGPSLPRGGFLVAGGPRLEIHLPEPPGRTKDRLGDPRPGVQIAIIVLYIEFFGEFPPLLENLGSVVREILGQKLAGRKDQAKNKCKTSEISIY